MEFTRFVVIDVIIVNNVSMSALTEVRANAKLFTTKKYYIHTRIFREILW